MGFVLRNWAFLAIIILIGWGAYLYKQNEDLKTNLADSKITVKSLTVGIQQYKAKDSSWNQRLINERLTISDIKNSSDSTINKLKDELDNAGIKLNNALAFGYSKTTIVSDTVIQYVRPKTPEAIAAIDTVLDFSKRPYIVNIVTLKPETAVNNLQITNEQFLITSAKKETVKPRKKFFIWRWFQKKHWVVYTDIHNSNPYLKTTDAKFVTILENDGSTKTVKN